jgi:signal peptidase I
VARAERGRQRQDDVQDEGAEEQASLAQRAWDQVWPLAVAVIIALGIRAVVIESYYVPSGSMLSTLLIGDHVFVNKFAYGARIPFTDIQLPALREPERGEIAVFALGRHGPGKICPLDQCPDYPAEGFVKRLVGLPGDTVEFRRGVLYLNGQAAVTQTRGEIFEEDGRSYDLLYEELDGCTHDVLDDPRQPPRDIPPFTVPEDRYYFLGDNRDNSNDSRFWGTVRRIDLKGPVMVNYWSWNNRYTWAEMANPINWFKLLWGEMRWGRIGKTYSCRD